MDPALAFKYEMRAGFAATNVRSHGIITNVIDDGPTTADIVRRWVNEACRRWYAEQAS